jgi:hypothetical protein
MSRCPKCGAIVIDLVRDDEGKVTGCKWCDPRSSVCKDEYMLRGIHGRSERCERKDKELTRALHDAGLKGSEKL